MSRVPPQITEQGDASFLRFPVHPGAGLSAHCFGTGPCTCVAPSTCLTACLPSHRQAFLSSRVWRCLGSFPQLEKQFHIEAVAVENDVSI